MAGKIKSIFVRPIKVILFIVFVLFLGEITIGYVNFQRSSDKGIALIWLGDRIVNKVNKFREKCTRQHILKNVTVSLARRNLFSDYGINLYNSIKESYEEEFREIVYSLSDHNVKLLLLYTPDPELSHEKNRIFFLELAQKHNLPFIDMRQEFTNFSLESLFLLPTDTHLTRFAHGIISEKLNPFISRHISHRSKLGGITVPIPQSPWSNNVDEIRRTYPGFPFRFRTDEYGFRWTGTSQHNTEKQTVLAIGDSFTYGTSVSDVETFPALLQSAFPTITVRNAGLPGASIYAEHRYIRENLTTIRPDVVIFQVNDGDLIDLMPFLNPSIYKLREKSTDIRNLEEEYLEALSKTLPTNTQDIASPLCF